MSVKVLLISVRKGYRFYRINKGSGIRRVAITDRELQVGIDRLRLYLHTLRRGINRVRSRLVIIFILQFSRRILQNQG